MNKILHTLIYGADVDPMLDGMHVETDMTGLEPNAYEEACKAVLWSWSSNFRPEIAECIRTYLRVSGLESIREDFQRVNERCERLEERCRLMATRDANLWQSCSVFAGEATRERRRADELEKILDSAVTPRERGQRCPHQ